MVINPIIVGLYTHYKDSLLNVGWVYPQYKEFRPWHMCVCIIWRCSSDCTHGTVCLYKVASWVATVPFRGYVSRILYFSPRFWGEMPPKWTKLICFKMARLTHHQLDFLYRASLVFISLFVVGGWLDSFPIRKVSTLYQVVVSMEVPEPSVMHEGFLSNMDHWRPEMMTSMGLEN